MIARGASDALQKTADQYEKRCKGVCSDREKLLLQSCGRQRQAPHSEGFAVAGVRLGAH